MRDHTKLKAFQMADTLVISTYEATRLFPKEELYVLTSQMRRAALSIGANIVEGCARHSHADYVHFLDISYGSAREVQYLITVSLRLGYISPGESIVKLSEETSKIINGLIRSLRKEPKK